MMFLLSWLDEMRPLRGPALPVMISRSFDSM